jgi:phospholipid transport system substrate-binding protein
MKITFRHPKVLLLSLFASTAVFVAPSIQTPLSVSIIGAHARAEVSPIEAQTFVDRASQQIISLITSDLTDDEKQQKLLELLDEYAVLEQIAKFVIGLDWRNMTEDQQTRYQMAFKDFMAHTYVSRFKEYSGETIRIIRAVDAGRKGQLVLTQIDRPAPSEPINVEWLVSDRSGQIKIEDLLVEGVSLAITQRDEFASMIAARQNNYDQFIADLQRKPATDSN